MDSMNHMNHSMMSTADPHAGHHMPMTTPDPHAGHYMHASTPDPHAGHHGHTADNGTGGHSGMMMYFHFGVNSTILFYQWTTSNWQGMLGSCVGIFFIAMLYEGLKVFREYLLRRSNVNVRYNTMPVSVSEDTMVTETHKTVGTRMLSCPHFIQTGLHMLQVIISYMLMLIFMTYNVYLCLAVVLGAGTGYFLFGWKRAIIVDINEHCH